MIKAVIFDMNGVIINDETIHELAFNRSLVTHGIRVSHEEYQKCCAGKTDRVGFETIAKEKNLNFDIDQAIHDKDQSYFQLFPANKKTYPGVIELIKSLKDKYKLAVCSGSVQREVEMILKEFDIFDCFKVVISAENVTRSKPDPEPYLLAAQRLGVLAEECVAIEDSPSGIAAAKAAGMKCIAITTTHEPSSLQSADSIVDDFKDVKKIIAGHQL